MGKSKRAKAAARAAKRIPIVGTAVVARPIVSAAANAGLSLQTFTDMNSWRNFLAELGKEFTATDRLAATYSPIVAYLVARRFAGKHISRVLGRFGLRF